jgi:hypothetical protein
MKSYKFFDLALEGMTVEEFWHHGDKDYKV